MKALFGLFITLYIMSYIMLFRGLANEFDEIKEILRNIEHKKNKENNNEHKSI